MLWSATQQSLPTFAATTSLTLPSSRSYWNSWHLLKISAFYQLWYVSSWFCALRSCFVSVWWQTEGFLVMSVRPSTHPPFCFIFQLPPSPPHSFHYSNGKHQFITVSVCNNDNGSGCFALKQRIKLGTSHWAGL